MRRTLWTPAVEDVFAEAWLSDAALAHLPRIMEARTGIRFTPGAMLSHAKKMGLTVRVDQWVTPAREDPRAVVEAPRKHVEPVRLVPARTFPVPHGGFSMLGRRGM